MAQFNFKPVFTVKALHTYFNDGSLTNLLFEPTESTMENIARFGMVIKSTEKGLSLFVITDDSIEYYLEDILESDDIDSFDFDIVISDSSFINYTDLPINQENLFDFQISYTSDQPLNQMLNGDIGLHADFLERQHETTLGQLHIKYEDLIKAVKGNHPANYNISFQARSTQWQYHIISQDSSSLDEYSIVSDTGLEFNDPVEVLLKNGQKAVLLSSQGLIPFSKRSQQHLSLLKKGSVLIPRLPSASPDQFTLIDCNGEKRLCSKIYINL